MTSTIRRTPNSSTRRRTTSSRSGTARTSTTGRAPAKKTTARKAPAKKSATRTATKKAATKKAAARKAPAKKATAKRAATRTAAKKATTRRAPATKTTAKKATARKAPAKKATTRKATTRTATGRSSTTARKTTTRKPATRSTSTRRTGQTRTQTGGRSTTARRGPRTTRSPDIGIDEAPAAFRARRRNDDEGRGGRRRKRAAASTRTRTRSRRRKSKIAVTDSGERNAAFLTATVLGLTLFGLVMVLSASSVSSLHQYADSPFFQFKRQVMWAAIGAVAFVVASRVDYRMLRPLATPLLLIVIGLLVALFVPGVGIEVQGSTRWLGIGPLIVQPSELAKLVFIIFIADLLTRRERRMDQPELTIRPVMLILGLLSALMILQPKLGTPIILGAISILVLFVAGARMRNLVGWLTAAILAASLAAYLAPYRRDRLLAFLNPWDDPQGIGLQAIQSQVGISSGGWYGVGLGASRAKWGFLPFAHTDFIFAIVAEEVGLIGASALIGGFLLIAWFGFRAAINAPDRFGSLLAAGITSWLLVQAFLNIGMVLGVMPITGEALPFVSAGGSSLVTTLAAAGLLTNVSRRSKE